MSGCVRSEVRGPEQWPGVSEPQRQQTQCARAEAGGGAELGVQVPARGQGPDHSDGAWPPPLHPHGR